MQMILFTGCNESKMKKVEMQCFYYAIWFEVFVFGPWLASMFGGNAIKWTVSMKW